MSTDRRARVFELLRHGRLARQLLNAADGVPCHFVGGILRDRLLGLGGHDFDAIVERQGRRISRLLAERLGARRVDLGRETFGAHRLVHPEFLLDVWDRRGVPLERDLARRDVTVNAFALDLADGRVVDPFGGLDDLARRVLRATTPGSFTGDPLRTLRLARLVAQLPGFSVDPATVARAREAAGSLPTIAAERVREELEALFQASRAEHGVYLLELTALYPGLWLGRPGEEVGASSFLRHLQRLAPASLRLREIAGALVGEPDLALVRWALSFLALPGATPAGERLLSFAGARYLTRERARALTPLLEAGELPRTRRRQRHFLHRTGRRWPEALLVAGSTATGGAARGLWEHRVEQLGELVRVHGDLIFDPPALVDGDEVQAICRLRPGPRVGEALARIRSAQIEGSVTSREEALALLRRSPGVEAESSLSSGADSGS